AAGDGEGAYHRAIALAEVAIKLLHHWIDRCRHGVPPVTEMQRRRRGDRHFRRRLGMRGDEFEMLDHGMRALGAELAHDAQHHRLWLCAPPTSLSLAPPGLP